jgi:uncharacterized protein
LSILSSVNDIADEEWDQWSHSASPFIQKPFFSNLERSGSIGPETGWTPLYFKEPDGVLYSFVKTHSYGEYIFDWQWADAYQRYQKPYYPKLTSMIPFTPVSSPHLLTKENNSTCTDRLLSAYHDFYESHELHSSHFLFLQSQEISLLLKRGYLIRDSFQYHFVNEEFTSFENFLQQLKGRKAKAIRKERVLPGITIHALSGSELRQEHAEEMYQLYLQTISEKNAIDYLKRDFFNLTFSNMRENILYVRAELSGQLAAGAIFFFDQERLYGRYWGSRVVLPNLHFELCYYQGIEFCIKNKLKVFEAGAQGEHKISRGFRPVKTFSAHHFKDPIFHQVIANFIQKERQQINILMDDLCSLLPFKSV